MEYIGLTIRNEDLKNRCDTLCELALKKWGNDLQLIVLLEELSELTKAILKFNREKEVKSISEVSDTCQIAIEEELVDVLIMIRQLIIMNGYDGILDDMFESKLDKLEGRILNDK